MPSFPSLDTKAERSGDRPMLFLLHFLGGSGNTWEPVIERLASFHCVPIDLPGFGDAALNTGYAVAEMADAVEAAIRAEAPKRWALAGHSMGAKIAAVVAARAERGRSDLLGLESIVLLAGSPPGPEPMDEERRQKMRGWFAGDAVQSRAEAEEFIDQNSAGPLPEIFREAAILDILRMTPEAWNAWLDAGSREDWAQRVGVLHTPALIVAGERDGDLGPAAQEATRIRHFAHGVTVTLTGAGHLLPLERPNEVANLIDRHLVRSERATGGPAYEALIMSDRVSTRTRHILLNRAQSDDPEAPPAALTPETMSVLRAAVERIVPQDTEPKIDIAARIDRALASGAGDGWRFAQLPPDRDAWDAGLRTLDATSRAEARLPFAALDAERQDRLLERAGEGSLGSGLISGRQMELWFEDLLAEAVKAYMSHPATLARIGYSGVANGGDARRKQGFIRVGIDEREVWEPIAAGKSGS